MNNIILFPHMLGQTKFGVKNTPNLVKKLIGKNKHYYNVNCRYFP